MRLLEVRRTSGFRVACLFFATFGTASLALSAFLYVDTRSYGRRAAFEWVSWESKHLLSLPPHALRERIDASEDFAEGGRPLVLFGADRSHKAGAPIPFPDKAPFNRPFILTQEGAEGLRTLFSQLTRLPTGEFVLVSRSAKDLEALEKALVETFFWGMAATIIIGLVGAVIFGAGSLRQNDAITKAVERIMRGDLSERLPTRGVSADLAHLTRIVNDMLDQLERLMLEIKGVNENIAHDLRTPLTRVVGTLERSLRKADTMEAFRACNEDALAEVKDIVVRFSALLRISEMEDRLRRSGFTHVDLARLLEDAVEYYEPLALEREIALSWERPNDPCAVEGDRSLIFEAVSNLIDNALKFTPSGGRVDVALMRDPPGIRVSDTGCGIPEKELGAVRERYRRGALITGKSGFGIGLSLVDSIARLHSARFTIASDEGGTRATLVWTPPVTAAEPLPRLATVRA
ncbi:sensor histidine kinase [Methylobacterium aerolatum]|uniref:histidine kinase n=1 Tax=Methylobacterium aerolatum TaxID=418708 RepID=A0ABU0I2H6_9HYPH|nr:HAMP domain-containing sensor histidine kinase [Methylobacterium aerolatum]MDQ0448800.1 signal transduction histidine kinase [Methylobacterium aerolatum]GJD34069.1 Adaptive-response sensory-kinase SasA [Methylobacterium aerolatum]